MSTNTDIEVVNIESRNYGWWSGNKILALERER